MILTNGRVNADISRELVVYSPCLEDMLSYNETQNVSLDSLFIDVDQYPNPDDSFNQLVSFLKGEQFTVTEEIYPLFEFMGFPNEGFGLEFYAVRLRDRWIRDHMYSLNLIDVSDYGLIEIDSTLQEELSLTVRSREIDRLKMLCEIDPRVVVAGGSTLCALGITDRSSDYDLFIVGDEGHSILNRLLTLNEELICNQRGIHSSIIDVISVSERCTEFTMIIGEDRHGHPLRLRCQIIHRLYRSMSEIVHGFDLDCCGILFHDDKFYCTARALHSLKNRCNVVDYARSSASYPHRLLKYANRGFRIECPNVSTENVNGGYIKDIASDVCKDMLEVGSYYDTIHGKHSDFSGSKMPRMRGDSMRLNIWEYPPRDQSMEDMLRIIDDWGRYKCGYDEVVVMIYHRLMYLSGDIRRFSMQKAKRRRVHESIHHLLKSFTRGEHIWTGLSGRDVLSSDIEFIARLTRFLNVHGTEHQPLDAMSRVLISSLLGITMYCEMSAISDYSNPTSKIDPGDVPELLENVSFNTQDPMTQVTSTWDPDHITSFEQLYKLASVYTESSDMPVRSLDDRFNVHVSNDKFIATPYTPDVSYSDFRVIENVPLDVSIRDLFTIVDHEEFNRAITLREQPREMILVHADDPGIDDDSYMSMVVVNRMIAGRSVRVLAAKEGEAGYLYNTDPENYNYPSIARFIMNEILNVPSWARHSSIAGLNIERLAKLVTDQELIDRLERERDERMK
uniref:Uncharacterized protein n=1 Tax=viral metagenome TaxID=1070528 RepID=A0A6C0BMP5_9ZZZZ